MSGREDQSMKTELTTSSGQRKMSWGEKGRADTNLELSFWLCVAAPTLLFTGLSSQQCICDEISFRSSPQIGAHNFHLSLHHLWLVFNSHLYLVLSVSQLTFKHKSSPYFCLVLREEQSVSRGSTPAQKIWNPIFFS